MKFKFRIDSYDNAAMADNQRAETVRLLHETAEKVENGYNSGVLRDENGNKVGFWAVTRD